MTPVLTFPAFVALVAELRRYQVGFHQRGQIEAYKRIQELEVKVDAAIAEIRKAEATGMRIENAFAAMDALAALWPCIRDNLDQFPRNVANKISVLFPKPKEGS